MHSHWLRRGTIDNKIVYHNDYPGIVVIRRIKVVYGREAVFTFYPEDETGTQLLKQACFAIFTLQEIEHFTFFNKFHSRTLLSYFEIKIGSQQMIKKLIAFCHHLNAAHSIKIFSDELISDLQNISLGILKVVASNYETKPLIYYSTPAYINPIYNKNINFNKIFPAKPTATNLKEIIQHFRNGYNPNQRDLLGGTLLYRLVSHYTHNKSDTTFEIIKLTLIYGGSLFELDNGPFPLSAAALAKACEALEILDLVLLNAKPERSLKVTQFESNLRENIIETKMVLSNKSTYKIELATINQINKNPSDRNQLFELFTLMYKNSDPEIIKAEFEDSFSNDDDEELTLVLLIRSNIGKIVGFTIY
ncbi:MAG: hypothetical protein JO131_05300, partial [Gammaproteobacteria bacterium]|nr:hypothetical protein [Gammaproteobacteria bacterium]